MGLNDKLTHSEAMSIYIGLAIGTVIGGATCIHRSQEANNSNSQTIESTVNNNATSNNNKGTIDYNSIVNKPIKCGDDTLICEKYDQTNRRLYFNSNRGRIYMNLNQFNAISGNMMYINISGNGSYFSMSTNRGYYPSSNIGMTSRPPAMFRYWNSINMASGYNPKNDTNYVKDNKNKVVNKIKTWIQNHRKNK